MYYFIYTTDGTLYNDYKTDWITTKEDVIATIKVMLSEGGYDYCIDGDGTLDNLLSVESVDNSIIITYIDCCEDKETSTWTLVPVKMV
jgi:hypothetical protein